MLYSQDILRCLEGSIGTSGLSESQLKSALELAETACTMLRGWQQEASLNLLQLPYRRDDLEACREAVDLLSTGKSNLFIFGTGGSSLGGQCLVQLAGYRVPGMSALEARPRLHFFDNLDGMTMSKVFQQVDLETTGFLVISKSGGTPETVVQMLTAIEVFKEAGLLDHLAKHMVVLTEPGEVENNILRALAQTHGLMVLDHDPGVGGRYAALSNVGLLPAMIAGLDPVAVREGAATVADGLQNDMAREFAPVIGAAVNFGLGKHSGITTSIMMPYSDRLRLFSAWYQQLWAESLGKDGHGTQPVAAAGPVDQHSQMQLFLDGPADKLLNVITTDSTGRGPEVPESYRDNRLVGYLAGRTIGDLTSCQQRATIETFARNKRPVRSFAIDQPDERSLGALMMHFMLETILSGLMLDVDPFDQPAVEESKILARNYLKSMSSDR